MKISFLLIILAAFCLSTVHAQDTIGDIKYSILEPGLFKKLHPGWILADGQDIRGSALSELTKMTNAPDARGVFLRGMNMDRSRDNGDAGGNRNICVYQTDELKSHSHLIGGPATQGSIVSSANNFYNEPVRRSDYIRTEPTGGDETRPRNIAIYIYIKIN